LPGVRALAYSGRMARLRTVFVGSVLGGILSVLFAPLLVAPQYRRRLVARRGRALTAFGGAPCAQDSCRMGDKETGA
jgi:hypothetical protein